jgi:hypothetical protein
VPIPSFPTVSATFQCGVVKNLIPFEVPQTNISLFLPGALHSIICRRIKQSSQNGSVEKTLPVEKIVFLKQKNLLAHNPYVVLDKSLHSLDHILYHLKI